MTRGTFYLIGHHHYYRSCEFNGDMYPDGHGRLAKELLDRVETTQDFFKMVAYFNDTNHKYSDEYPLVYVKDRNDLNTDFNDEYFEHWFSDWVFIKNISDSPLTFTYRPSEGQTEKETVEVKKGGLLIVNFGHKPSDEDLKELGLVR